MTRIKRYFLATMIAIGGLIPGLVAAETTSNVACYFADGNKVTWQWALNSDNSYFKFKGDWKKTRFTKIERFESTASYDTLCSACANAKVYYKVKGELLGTFAATSNTGSNYPIVLNGVVVSPDL